MAIRLSPDIVKVSPFDIRWKIAVRLARVTVDHARWETQPRYVFEATEKARAITAHFVHGTPWGETSLFSRNYAARFAAGGTVRGCATLKKLIAQYDTRVDGLFADLKAHGWSTRGTPIPVYVAHDDAMLLGTDGNHRMTMARILQLPAVVVRIIASHPDSTRAKA